MILLAESGSTKTDWRIIGDKVYEFETIGLNPYFVDSEDVKRELETHIPENLAPKIQEVHFYGTGITNEEKGEVIAQGVLAALNKTCKVSTYSDVIAAAKSLFGDNQGIACILGTGSNSCFWNGEKIDFQVPPLGFWLGDEGSGGHLGKMLILSYLHKEIPEDIRELFEVKYGNKDRIEIINHAYNLPKPNRYFAQYSSFLLENISNPFCRELVSNAFKLFFEKYLLKYPQIKDQPIGVVGSIGFYFSEVLEVVAKGYNLSIHKIVQKPIEKLVEYHSEHYLG